MPIAVPIHERISSRRVIKPHSEIKDVVQTLYPETSRPVAQPSDHVTRLVGTQPEISYRSNVQVWPSFATSSTQDAASRPGLLREGSDLGHGLIAAAISKQTTAEAGPSPVRALVPYPTMGLQCFPARHAERYGTDQTWGGGQFIAAAPQSASDMPVPMQGQGYASYDIDAFSFVKPYQYAGSGVEEGHCDSSLHSAVTPFADFADRIVASEARHHGGRGLAANTPLVLPQLATPGHQPRIASTEPLSNPAYIRAYRALAEPLSEWMADYVWKVCTDGVNLPRRFVGLGSSRKYDKKPSSTLAKSIHSILCSTLLQPSAIILALWYMTRLPVVFDAQAMGVDLTRSELDFRKELFGEGRFPLAHEEKDQMRTCAPFRVALLGCMLANKWLDDHTFSNKTWQSISDVPIQSINRLELAALAVLGHDLSVTPKSWDMWLTQLHRLPVPIGRPSSNDSLVIARKMISDLAQLLTRPDSENAEVNRMQPVFSPLLMFEFESKVETLQTEHFDPFEINLDEDGPLREEYVPRRRPSSKTGTNKRSPVGACEWTHGAESSDDAGRADTRSLTRAPTRDTMTAPFLISNAQPRATAWNGGVSFDHASVPFIPQQITAVNTQGNFGFVTSSVCLAPPVGGPTNHSGTSFACQGSSTELPAHSQTYHHSICNGEAGNSCWFPSCSRFVGHLSTYVPGQMDACHFRPLWLKT